MPDFIVSVCRTAHGFRDFLVQGAKNEHEAMVTAESQAGNHSFSEKNSDYEINGVIQLEAGQTPAGHLQILTPGPRVIRNLKWAEHSKKSVVKPPGIMSRIKK